MVESGAVAVGCRSLVVACVGSQVKGILHPAAAVEDGIDADRRKEAWEEVRGAVEDLTRRTPVDLVHMHGVDFHHYLPPEGIPTLVTLHLPIEWYPKDILELRRRDVHFNCVSYSQRDLGGPAWADAPVVENGINLEEAGPPMRKRRFALALGRVCPEKGFHHAVEAAKRARLPLVIGGRVYPYPGHVAYFREQLAPLLDDQRRYVGTITGKRKQRLLASAQCLVVPSLVEETSSLAAMEALAAGTPVVAYSVGALADIVEPGRTGFLVDDVAQMAEAIELCRKIDPEACRQAARRRFGAFRMIGGYLSIYGAIMADFQIRSGAASVTPVGQAQMH
jgi:glycosyltransferase involved in cell wall biosynthesis